MRSLLQCLRAPGGDERGATSIEYALLAALIAVAIVFSATTLGRQVAVPFQNVGSGLAAAITP
jgi:pilus assembly protein Flp/PilA